MVEKPLFKDERPTFNVQRPTFNLRFGSYFEDECPMLNAQVSEDSCIHLQLVPDFGLM